MRGYQSTVDQRLHFGLGSVAKIDSLIIQWPNAGVQVLTDVGTNQLIVIQQQDGVAQRAPVKAERKHVTLFSDATLKYAIHERHVRTDFIDFNRDPLLFQMLSEEGPELAV